MNDPPKDGVFLELDGRADYFTTEPQVELRERASGIKPRTLAVALLDADDLGPLMGPRVVDKTILVANISFLLRGQSQATLRQVVDAFGLKYGLSELMAYGSIAAASSRHLINAQHQEYFDLGDGRGCEFPELIFCR